MLYLEPLQMPETVEYDKKTYTPNFGRFEIGPLEPGSVSYTHLRAHETPEHLVCRLLLEKKKKKKLTPN